MANKILVGVATALLVALAFGLLEEVHASDPELTTDFFVPPGKIATDLNGKDFKFTLFEKIAVTSAQFATVTAANTANLSAPTGFGALRGLGISSAFLTFPPGTVNRPHTHPRGTELLFIIEGYLDVGFVDTANILRTESLQPGDLFVFPKGLLHFQINWGTKYKTVTALAALSSENPGTLILPQALFGSKGPINDEVLAKSFGVSEEVIQALKDAQKP